MRTESGMAVVFVAAIVMHLFHFPGAGILTVLSLGMLSTIYFPFGFYFCSGRKLKEQNIVMTIFGGMFLSTAVNGILFKLQRYPGSGIMLLIGAIGAIILLLLVIIIRRKKPLLRKYYRNMFVRSVVIGLLAGFLYVIPTATIIKVQFRDDPEHARLIIQSFEEPWNEKYRKELEQYELGKYFTLPEEEKTN